MRPIKVTISRRALENNLAQVKVFAPDSKIMAVVKANGYGHQLERVAKMLANASTPPEAFAVASIDEALQLRQCQITQPVVLLEGAFSAEEINLAQEK